MTNGCDHSTVQQEPRKESASDDGASMIVASPIDPGLDGCTRIFEGPAPSPTVVFSEHEGLEVTMSEPRSVHATFYPPKGVSACCEDVADDDEQAEPCGPTKSRLDGSPERCREVRDEFCAQQDLSEFTMDEEFASVAASLAANTFPPVARAALEEELDLAPGSLTDGSVQVVRMRSRRMEAEVVVLDPVQKRMRSAYVRLIGPEELGELARVLELLKSWEPAAARTIPRKVD